VYNSECVALLYIRLYQYKLVFDNDVVETCCDLKPLAIFFDEFLQV